MRFFRFLVSVKDEMKQVSWPDAKQTRKDTTSVIAVAVSMAIFLGLVDYLIQIGLKLMV
ncbi:preprotein translocase subunit SecE [Secundilactobacillus folii]|uniref:Protein translocase subunit SecE n=1 Tax=Secundilactobacillus folii TaxID=2678357 RepID=A0A7X3C3C6_9LACO|nr:preprotein translocase subunit SecE [Secundilactobacillus folii]MTV82382.1 preprotein translocase subunit SecE [Secundilactobacillus folii]